MGVHISFSVNWVNAIACHIIVDCNTRLLLHLALNKWLESLFFHPEQCFSFTNFSSIPPTHPNSSKIQTSEQALCQKLRLKTLGDALTTQTISKSFQNACKTELPSAQTYARLRLGVSSLAWARVLEEKDERQGLRWEKHKRERTGGMA